MSRKEWVINLMKMADYNKFLKSHVFERRKQKNINNGQI